MRGKCQEIYIQTYGSATSNRTDCGGFCFTSLLSPKCGVYSWELPDKKSKVPVFPAAGGPGYKMTSALNILEAYIANNKDQDQTAVLEYNNYAADVKVDNVFRAGQMQGSYRNSK